MQKQSKYLWLAIPPILAVLVFYGPLSQQTQAPRGPRTPAGSEATDTLSSRSSDNLWRVGSALLGVLVLGVAGVAVMARLRNGAAPSTRPGQTPPMNLRQSLRLGPKNRVHAVEFEDRLLLIGESEGNLCLLFGAPDGQAAADEQKVLGRASDEQGVDLRDTEAMVLRSLPPQPGQPLAQPGARRPAGAANRLNKKADVAAANLADFKSLLRKARAQV